MPFTLTRAEVRELDRRAIEGFGVPGLVLMENAGRGAAELLMRLNPGRAPALVLCGPGNNGGDGFVVARHLDNAGWPVKVHVFARHTRGDNAGGADTNFDILFTSGIEFTQFRPDNFDQPHRDLFLKQLAPATWVVDALFGNGLTRPLADPFDWLVGQVNATGKPVLALDLPSGLDCDTGEPIPLARPADCDDSQPAACEFGVCVKAAHTATFVAPKRGFLNPASKAWTGEVHTIDIGAPRVLVEEYRQRAS
jgi:NAD(P)H-hydrate epimerase